MNKGVLLLKINEDLKLNQVLEAIPLGIVVFDNNWKIIVVNSSIAGILGIDPKRRGIGTSRRS